MPQKYRRLFSSITLFFVIQLQFFQSGFALLQNDLPEYIEEPQVEESPP
jgi:hypothetical protein